MLLFNSAFEWAVVVAQLVEQSLLTSEIRGSYPDIGKMLSNNCKIEKTKIKKKRPGMAHLLKNSAFAAEVVHPNDLSNIGTKTLASIQKFHLICFKKLNDKRVGKVVFKRLSGKLESVIFSNLLMAKLWLKNCKGQ